MNVSINGLTQESYTIPKDLNDEDNLKHFLQKNSGKKVIVVQGLGFVGAVMALVCANSISEEYAVIGVDLATPDSYWKIKSINEGIFPLIADDPKINEYFTETQIKGNFYATYDQTAYKYADFIIVDINLDVEKKLDKSGNMYDFDVDLSKFKSAINSIASVCKKEVLILVETTVPPGTCEKIVKPIIEENLIKRNLSTKDYCLGHSYERVMPGPEYINSIREFPRVFSGTNNKNANAVESFLKTIIDTSICELTRLKHTNATEMAKVLENSYRAMNISFAIEWSRFAEEAGVDMYTMVDAIRVRKTHANLMYPGIGVGGYCLTKDPLLASWARKNFFGSAENLNMSINSVKQNDKMPIFAYNRLVEVFGNFFDKKVLFLGVSYRGDVGDTRFTPVQPLMDMLLKERSEVLLHDPYVSYWQEQNCSIENNLNRALQCDFDLIIVSSGHNEYKSSATIKKLMAISPTKIYDTIGLYSNEQLTKLQLKHQVSVLGRGDIY